MLKQLVHYIDKQSLLLLSISDFKKGKSTTTVLLGIRDDRIRAMKRGEVTMMVMADYSKAFDTVTSLSQFLPRCMSWDSPKAS